MAEKACIFCKDSIFGKDPANWTPAEQGLYSRFNQYLYLIPLAIQLANLALWVYVDMKKNPPIE